MTGLHIWLVREWRSAGNLVPAVVSVCATLEIAEQVASEHVNYFVEGWAVLDHLCSCDPKKC